MAEFFQTTLPGFSHGKKPIAILSVTNEQVLLDVARRGLLRDYIMIELALRTGMRNGELIGLNWEDVLYQGKITNAVNIPARIAKGGRARRVPFCSSLTLDMSTYYANQVANGQPVDPWSPVFVSQKTRNRLTTRDFQRICKVLGRLALNQDVNPHLLRHTFATRLLENTNLSVVQVALGHASLTSTQIYLHPSSDDLMKAVNHLDHREA